METAPVSHIRLNKNKEKKKNNFTFVEQNECRTNETSDKKISYK